MPRPPRYLEQKYMEPTKSQLLNWERNAERRELLAYGVDRYAGWPLVIVRNPLMKPLLSNGGRPRG